MNVVICGGGNIAHALAAVLSQTDNVSILTRRPESWEQVLFFKKGEATYRQSGLLHKVSADPLIVVDASLIIIAVPRFAICDVIGLIAHNLHKGQVVAFIPAPAGLEDLAAELKRECNVETIGFQRVPYIARVVDYGRSVTLSNDRAVHKTVMTTSMDQNFWDEYFTSRFGGRIEHLSSFFAFTFSNANPLLHPARLMVLLKEPQYARMPLFYEEWTDESSKLYVKSDAEMLAVMRKFPEIDIGRDYESAFDHYGVGTITELTQRIRLIPSFKGIKAPYKLCNGNYVPDLSSRYFTEDVTYGTMRIQALARKVGVATPTIDMFVERIQKLMQS